jgi:carbon monoxide dehydrogenase subunit G
MVRVAQYPAAALSACAHLPAEPTRKGTNRVKITGSYTIDAPREQVWAALNDIDVLARVVPGCERLDQTGENEFEGQVKIGIQSIKGTYSGKIRLEDVTPPSHYKLVAHGKSANGVVDGAGTGDLEEQDGKTLLRYGGEAQIGGVLASVGQRLIEGASRQLINQSLKALTEQVAQRAAKAAVPASAPAEPPAPPPAPATVEHAAPTPNGIEHAAPLATAAPDATPAAAPPAPERRTVVVPPEEQLKPESMVLGVVTDFIAERPWLPWVIVAFLLGVLFGRSRSS